MYSGGKPPRVIEPLLDMEVNAGEDLTLECDLDLGEPKANITWYRDSKEIYPSK